MTLEAQIFVKPTEYFQTFKLKHTLAQHIAKSHPTRINL